MYPRRRPAGPVLALFIALFLCGTQAVQAGPTNAAKEAHEANLKGINKELRVIANSFENAWIKDDVQLATRLFDLEARALEHLRRVGNQRKSNTRETRLDDTAATLRRIFELQEVLWQRGIDKIQEAMPGEPAAELIGKRVDRYRPLDRKGARRKGGPNRKAAVREAKEASDAEPRDFDRRFVKSLPSIARVTWVRNGGKVTASIDPTAKHLALADGENINGAGDALIMKNDRGEVIFAAVQNTSGSYKSGPASLEWVRQALIKEVGVPADRVTTTFSRPTSAGLVNLLLRAKGVEGDIADRRQARLERKADRYRTEKRDLSRSRGRARRTDVKKFLKQSREVARKKQQAAKRNKATSKAKPRRTASNRKKARARAR